MIGSGLGRIGGELRRFAEDWAVGSRDWCGADAGVTQRTSAIPPWCGKSSNLPADFGLRF
jgi:hypothetical protein